MRTARFRAGCLLLIANCLLGACSIPNLEPPECDKARDVVREVYSRHFGYERSIRASIDQQKEFLTPRLFAELDSTQPVYDPFTLTDDPPMAFRVGGCRVLEPEHRVDLEVLLFWKTDTRSEQRPIRVEADNSTGKWLIDRVTN
jgi:hypothetical protein